MEMEMGMEKALLSVVASHLPVYVAWMSGIESGLRAGYFD
jgi:hypothetical protein